MNYLMGAQMGLSLMNSWGEYRVASIRADLQGKIQDYRNAMQRLSAARVENAVTLNQTRVRDSAVAADQLLQRTSIRDQAQAKVQAAAAGVSGSSVEMVVRDLRASAGRASYAQRRQAHQQLAELDEQKTSIAIGAITGQDVQVIPRPSVGSLLLGAGTNLISIYDRHQPDGSRVLE